ISSGSGLRRHPILGGPRPHLGIDLVAPRGTPVRAASDGTVRARGRNGGYGHYVRLDHGFGLHTAYGHLSRYAEGLRPGRRVTRGQVIGYVGSTGRSTGPHLHYEVWMAGRAVDPVDFLPVAVRRYQPG
nr:M23 family metallopeptidase [Gammaproteobacteria bacterium]